MNIPEPDEGFGEAVPSTDLTNTMNKYKQLQTNPPINTPTSPNV